MCRSFVVCKVCVYSTFDALSFANTDETAGLQLLLEASTFIPDTGPYTVAEAGQRLAKAATFAALAACNVLKVSDATRKRIVDGSDAGHVADFEQHHTPAWDKALASYIEEVSMHGFDDDMVSFMV